MASFRYAAAYGATPDIADYDIITPLPRYDDLQPSRHTITYGRHAYALPLARYVMTRAPFYAFFTRDEYVDDDYQRRCRCHSALCRIARDDIERHASDERARSERRVLRGSVREQSVQEMSGRRGRRVRNAVCRARCAYAERASRARAGSDTSAATSYAYDADYAADDAGFSDDATMFSPHYASRRFYYHWRFAFSIPPADA